MKGVFLLIIFSITVATISGHRHWNHFSNRHNEPINHQGNPNNIPYYNYPQQSYPQQSYPEQSFSQQWYPQQSYPQHSYPKHSFPQQNYANILQKDYENAAWICRSPKTGDMMLITEEELQNESGNQQVPVGNVPQGNIPTQGTKNPGLNKDPVEHPDNVNLGNIPDGNAQITTPSSTTIDPKLISGEGKIDIRMGE